jgi:hypothetical protein
VLENIQNESENKTATGETAAAAKHREWVCVMVCVDFALVLGFL